MRKTTVREGFAASYTFKYDVLKLADLAMSLRFSTLLLVAFSAQISSSTAGANAADLLPAPKRVTSLKSAPLAVGIKLFEAKSYDASIRSLKEAVRLNPRDGLGHYYLANALVLGGKGEEARKEFALAYNSSSQTAIRDYCRRALDTYALSEQRLVNAERAKRRVERAVTVIHDQLDREKSRNVVAADSLSARAANSAEVEVAKITNTTIHSTGVAPYVAPGDSQKKRTFDSSNSAVSQAEEDIRIERLAAKAKAEEYKRRSDVQNSQAEDVAASLESQLKSSGIRGSATLHPEGTGYFVRYYGKSEPGQVLPNVHQGVVRIVPSNTVDVPAVTSPGSTNRVAPQSVPNRKGVRANVLKP